MTELQQWLFVLLCMYPMNMIMWCTIIGVEQSYMSCCERKKYRYKYWLGLIWWAMYPYMIVKGLYQLWKTPCCQHDQ